MYFWINTNDDSLNRRGFMIEFGPPGILGILVDDVHTIMSRSALLWKRFTFASYGAAMYTLGVNVLRARNDDECMSLIAVIV
jgi:hypothetical protein